ncbi:TIGR01777 family oxidoreductase [Candidatus Oscillochloris fontis]|uniref:TIGR01777 family oxidoreductase n=1 Tax=Candidatus Oscillochloris fontis TaxID=2496868 RepID=UPI00101CB649|nr:TIGR01777 family oxidoreductase [Candidatus Oscillochloris fontis]
MSETKRVILTGATGVIGRRLFMALVMKGYEVVIFSRSPQKAREQLPGAADYVRWAPTTTGAWAASINGAYGVIHLAGAPIAEGILGQRWVPSIKANIYDSRIIGTRGIVEAISTASNRPQVLLSASGVGYYGFRDSTALDEQASPGSDFLAKVCVDWEREALRAQEFGVRVACMRTGLVLDPDNGVLPQIMQPFKLRVGGPVLPGTQYYSWIHPDDLVGIYLLALEHEGASGPINAVAPSPQTNRSFSSTLGKVMGSPSWMPVPEFSLRVLLGEMADLVVHGQRALPKKAQALGYHFRYPQLEPALRNLIG